MVDSTEARSSRSSRKGTDSLDFLDMDTVVDSVLMDLGTSFLYNVL